MVTRMETRHHTTEKELRDVHIFHLFLSGLSLLLSIEKFVLLFHMLCDGSVPRGHKSGLDYLATLSVLPYGFMLQIQIVFLLLKVS